MSKQRPKVKTEKTQSFLGSKTQRDAIYEIYRSCRLCGAGSGYKIPIIQRFIPVKDTEVELKTKIQECLQIEVHEADKMPPLICELCADKINDFYDFLVMCRQTYEHTRMKLGLGPLSGIRKNIDSIDKKIVKIEKNVSGRGKSNEKESIKKGKVQNSVKNLIKKESDKFQMKKETRAERELRELIESNPMLSSSQRSRCCRTRENRQSLKRQPSPPPKKPNLRSDYKSEKIEIKKELRIRPGPASTKLKRLTEVVTPEVSCKKTKIEESRSKRLSAVKATDSNTSVIQTCDICQNQFPRGISFNNHYRIHKRIETSSSSSKPEEILQSDDEAPKIVGTCRKCGKQFSVYSTFKKHQAACKGGRVKIPPSLRRGMKPVQVRMMRCDSLLSTLENGHYDVSDVRCPYGLDRSCLYPYNKHNSLLHSNRMVDIKFPEIPDAFDIDDDTEEIVHWDSDSQSDEDTLSIESLSRLCLKVIFSDKFLGKVPKRRKKVKTFENHFGFTIERIISNLDKTETEDSKTSFDNIKDNWSDNVSDSILRNDNNSDTFSFIGDLNDDSCTYNNKGNNDINDTSLNETTEARQDERSSPIADICKLELSNRRDNFDAETNTNDSTDNCNQPSDIITDNSLTPNQESAGSENSSERNQEDPWSNSTDKNTCQLDNLNSGKSGIELLEIQILNDNDEVCSQHSNTENRYNERPYEENFYDKSVPRSQDSADSENSLNENVPQTEKLDENRVNEKVNNEDSHVNTDTNDNEKEILDRDRFRNICNTNNIDVSLQSMQDIPGRNDIISHINTNDLNKDGINQVNTEPEIIIQNCFSLSNNFDTDGKTSQNNEIQNTTTVQIDTTTKTDNCQRNTIDLGDLGIYDDIFDNNILNGEKRDAVHRPEHKTNVEHKMNGDDTGVHSNDLDEISDEEMDSEKVEKSNLTLDELLPDRSMDLDSISDGEFTFDD